MKTTLCGREIAMPLFLAPTALQRLFHWQGERAVLRAAANAGTGAGISSLATIGLAEAGALTDGPKLFQLYVHHDEGLNQAMLDAARDAKFDAVALTVDTIVGGNRERCLRSGFTSPPRSEEHTSELQSLMRISYAVFCLKKKTTMRDYIYIY